MSNQEIFVLLIVTVSYLLSDVNYLAGQYTSWHTLLCAFWSLIVIFNPHGLIMKEQRIRIIAILVVVNSIFMFMMTQQPIFGILSIVAGLVLIFV